MNYKHWLYSVPSILIALFLSVLSASQVYAVSVSQDVTLQTTSGSDITLLSGSDFDTLTVNSNSFTFTLSGSQSVSLRDNDSQILKTNIDGLQGSCSSGNSEITLPASKGSSITLSIEGFACSSGGGGGGSYTSSGGSSPSSESTQTTTAATTTASTTTQAVTQTTPSSYLEGAPPPAMPLDGITPPPVLPCITASVFPGLMQIKRGLDVGATGEDVRVLQEALASMSDVYPEGKVSGFYGALTKAAVGKFQMKYGLVSSVSDPGDGYVGPKTRAKLQEVFAINSTTSMPNQSSASVLPSSSAVLTRDLALGATGDDVTQLQAFLAADSELYPEGKVTGYYGSLTVAAVKRFQAKHGISQLGRVGPQTLKKLNEVMGQGSGVPDVPASMQEDEEAKADLQKQIADLQALIESLTKQVSAQ